MHVSERGERLKTEEGAERVRVSEREREREMGMILVLYFCPLILFETSGLCILLLGTN